LTIQKYFIPCIYLCMGTCFTALNICEYTVSFVNVVVRFS